jgi:hypothetical protein
MVRAMFAGSALRPLRVLVVMAPVVVMFLGEGWQRRRQQHQSQHNGNPCFLQRLSSRLPSAGVPLFLALFRLFRLWNPVYLPGAHSVTLVDCTAMGVRLRQFPTKHLHWGQ